MSDTPLLSIRPESSFPISLFSEIQDGYDKNNDSKLSFESKSPQHSQPQVSSRSQTPPLVSISSRSAKDEKPSFNYDLELFNYCKKYLDTKNHHGLALIARQKGVPPFLRFKIWPLLLKYHPFVLNPFIQPDTDINEDETNEKEEKSSDEDKNLKSKPSDNTDSDSSKAASTDQKKKSKSDDIRSRIKKDLRRYVQRLKYSTSSINLSGVETQMLETLENSILKFSNKWGKIIKYDQALTWIALNLAEWFPPIQNTPWVLVGRDNTSQNNSIIVNFMDDYCNYIDNIPDLKEYLENLIADENFINMSFHDVYERLVLVLLHSPEERNRESRAESLSTDSGNISGSNSSSQTSPASLSRSSSSSSRSSRSSFSSHRNIISAPKKVNKTVLPTSGGTIEERVSFFIYCLRKVLPELSDYFHEEQILNKFGSNDDEWLIWWLNYCGSKVWSKVDRGRIWDSLLGWRLKNSKKDMSYYVEKLQINSKDDLKKFLQKLGPDTFWSLSSIDDSTTGKNEANDNPADDSFSESNRRSSFKDLVEELSNRTREGSDMSNQKTSPVVENKTDGITVPFSQIDAHIELVFISIAFLKSKENFLVELDQHEIRQFLSRLPTKSYKYKQRKHHTDPNVNGHQQNTVGSTPTSLSISSSPCTSSSPIIDDELSSCSTGTENEDNDIIISNDSVYNHKVDFMNNIIDEAGELWRKWLWSEMVDDN